MKTARQQAGAMEAKRRADNAEKAWQTADNEFPDEKWKFVEEGIYLSPRKKPRI